MKNLNQSKEICPSAGERSYEIKVAGHLDEHWSGWLGGLDIIHDTAGNTLLAGALPDQAALHGILNQIRDLGLVLISLESSEVYSD
jgi:hypothetical protein